MLLRYRSADDASPRGSTTKEAATVAIRGPAATSTRARAPSPTARTRPAAAHPAGPARPRSWRPRPRSRAPGSGWRSAPGRRRRPATPGAAGDLADEHRDRAVQRDEDPQVAQQHQRVEHLVPAEVLRSDRGQHTSSPTTGASRPSSGSRRLRVAVMSMLSSGSPTCRTVATGLRAADRPSGSPTPTNVAASGTEVDQGRVVGRRGPRALPARQGCVADAPGLGTASRPSGAKPPEPHHGYVQNHWSGA